MSSSCRKGSADLPEVKKLKTYGVNDDVKATNLSLQVSWSVILEYRDKYTILVGIPSSQYKLHVLASKPLKTPSTMIQIRQEAY